MPSIARTGFAVIAAAAILSGMPVATGLQARPAPAAQVNIPVSDSRNVGPASVRFAAAQLSKNAPTVAIFNVTKTNWPKLRGALETAVAQGYRVEGIFIGPDDIHSVEIFAKGQRVTNAGIDPDTITGPELTRLVQQISQRFYS